MRKLHEHPLIEFELRLKRIDKFDYWFDAEPNFEATVELITQSTFLDVKVDDYLIDLVNCNVNEFTDKKFC